MLTRKKIDKTCEVKEVKKKEANKILKIKDESKIIIGLFRKEKLIGITVGYDLSKKEFKRNMKGTECKLENVMKWQTRITGKFADDIEMRNFFQIKRYSISHKKFPKVCYAFHSYRKNA